MHALSWRRVGEHRIDAPDLRESVLAMNWEAFRSVLHEGRLAAAGMPMYDDLSDEDMHAIFTYIRQRAREAAHPLAKVLACRLTNSPIAGEIRANGTGDSKRPVGEIRVKSAHRPPRAFDVKSPVLSVAIQGVAYFSC